jgi:POT family proton-dependent oligopeptide transporter
MQVIGVVAREISTPTGLILFLTGLMGFGYLLVSAARATVVERHRLWVALILMVFSMLFWAFFEQAGSSINNFTDRNVDRVREERMLTQADVGTVVDLELTRSSSATRSTESRSR